MRHRILLVTPLVIASFASAQSNPSPIGGTRVNHVAHGEFTVELLPLTMEGQPESAKFGRMSINKTISGDLVAVTTGQMLSVMTHVDGSAGYVAIEWVEGSLHGKNGGFALQHSGTMNRGAPGLVVTVVPDSGTDELVGLAGEFKITMVDGRHGYEFSYSLPQRNDG